MPLDGVAVMPGGRVPTVQAASESDEVTAIVWEPPDVGMVHDVGATEYVAVAPACVTVTLIAPTVTVAVRGAPLFVGNGCAVRVKLPEPVPPPPVTASHEEALVGTSTLQETPATVATPKACTPPEFGTAHERGETSNASPACVSVTV
jgi:hypothetical protein